MKMNRTVKITLWSLLTLFVLFNAFMVWHVLDMTKKANNIDNRTIQVSRIDFKEPIDSLKAKEITKNMKSISGVRNPHYFKERNVVVYLHDMKIVNSKQVYDQLMKKGTYKAERFIVPENLAGKEVCPAMKKDGFYYNYTQLVLRIFN